MGVARRLGDVELVSIDSKQVYRGMDIGTAKPTPAERSEIPHHLLDLVEPTDEFTVSEFRDEYAAALVRIADCSHRALLVGGTGLYHRVVIDDFDLPGQWTEIRAELEADDDSASLFQRLRTLDPAAADKVEPANRRRVIRALEVTLGSGRPFSSFGPGVHDYPPSEVVQIGLRWPREVITARIAERVRHMFDHGLVAEVSALVDTGFSRTAAQALGYGETMEMLAGRMSEDEAVAMIVARTRKFAVRQERWFRRDPRVRWIDIEHDAVAEAAPVVIDALTA